MSVPALIAKGRDYFVHVVREHSDGYPFWSGYTLLHTRRSTGVMTRLLTTSDWTAQQIVGGNWADPETAIGMAPQLHSRLVGICSDPERLYALVRQEGIDILCEKFAGEILLVFCLQDGSKLAELEVKGGTLWKPAEGLHEGPMRPIRNGVSIYGKTFLFRGKEVQQR